MCQIQIGDFVELWAMYPIVPNPDSFDLLQAQSYEFSGNVRKTHVKSSLLCDIFAFFMNIAMKFKHSPQ